MNGELPSEITFSRIQDPASHASRLRGSAERCLISAEFITRSLGGEDGLVQEIKSRRVDPQAGKEEFP